MNQTPAKTTYLISKITNLIFIYYVFPNLFSNSSNESLVIFAVISSGKFIKVTSLPPGITFTDEMLFRFIIKLLWVFISRGSSLKSSIVSLIELKFMCFLLSKV